jgi:hypothetical protein
MLFSYLTLTDRKQNLRADFLADCRHKIPPKSVHSEISGRTEEECLFIVTQIVTIFTIKCSYFHNKNIFIFIVKI